MRKLGSVEYLKMAHKMILTHHEKFEIPQREGKPVDTQKLAESWDGIVEFARMLKEDILGIPGKSKERRQTPAEQSPTD